MMSLVVDIRKNYGKFQLDVSFETGSGHVTGLLGASGCGKSVTLKCIAGIETPDEGRIILDGRVLFDREKGINLSPQRRHVGYLFQNYALFPNMTVKQNITVGVRDRKAREETAERLIQAFGLAGNEQKYPRQLSGGQEQRSALARILGSGPEALLLGAFGYVLVVVAFARKARSPLAVKKSRVPWAVGGTLLAALITGEGFLLVIRSLVWGAVGGVLLLFLLGAVTLVSQWDRVPATPWQKLRSLLTFPLYTATCLPVSVAAVFCRVEWRPIRHTVAISRAALPVRGKKWAGKAS